MNFVQKIRRMAGRYMLGKEMNNFQRRGNAVSFESARKIGILYDAGKKENYEAVKNLVRRLRNQQKEAKSLGFIFSRSLPGDQFIKLGMDFFTLAQVNWHFKPGSKLIDQFMKEEFDILINLDTEEVLPLEYISLYSRAIFRIGKYSERNKLFYDFMIRQQAGEDVPKLIQDVEHYLQVIHSGTSTQSSS